MAHNTPNGFLSFSVRGVMAVAGEPYAFYDPNTDTPGQATSGSGRAGGVGVTGSPNDPGTTGSTGEPNDPVGGTIKTIADLISQGAGSGATVAASQPVVVPTSGGGIGLLPILVLGGLGIGAYFLFRKKAA